MIGRMDQQITLSPPHGGVDRNCASLADVFDNAGRPLTGAWIETSTASPLNITSWVAPSRGRGSKLIIGQPVRDLEPSPTHGGVDRNTMIAPTML